MRTTKIEWTESTWNPITGCSKISPGCANCYAERMSKRLAGRCGYPADEPFRVTLHADRIDQPLRWRKPRMIFVCSMGDLFHEDVEDEWIALVYDVMRRCHQHTFQILTKRPERALYVLTRLRSDWNADGGNGRTWVAQSQDDRGYRLAGGNGCVGLRNVWLGVTAEDQPRADERIPLLLQIPVEVRFVSCEPLLGEIDFSNIAPQSVHNCNALKGIVHYPIQNYWKKLDWVIVGGETGPGARPMHPDRARSIRDQCVAANVPFFFKKHGSASTEPYQRFLDDVLWEQMP